MAYERFKKFNIDPLIAKTPAEPRDSARLMILNRKTRSIENKIFRDIPSYFNSGDCLVINDTKVFPAKLFGKKNTGGKIEILLVRPLEKPNVWAVLTREGKEGMEINFESGLRAKMLGRGTDMETVLEFNSDDVLAYAQTHGSMPIPVYIEKARKRGGLSAGLESDKERYQTVYAREEGSIAAPTAGFHFTPQILDELRAKGVSIVYITLHVGWGTFRPLKTEPEQHKMLAEYAQVSSETADIINKIKTAGGRIFSVGTTSTRTLESFSENGKVTHGGKWTDLFIYPGYKFKTVDCLITNFHFPDSTPLCLASAFADEDFIYQAYSQAVEEKYRFYSFGDSMLIL